MDKTSFSNIPLGFKTCHRENLLEGRGGPNMRGMHKPPPEGTILREQRVLGSCQHLEQKLSCHLPAIELQRGNW